MLDKFCNTLLTQYSSDHACRLIVPTANDCTLFQGATHRCESTEHVTLNQVLALMALFDIKLDPVTFGFVAIGIAYAIEYIHFPSGTVTMSRCAKSCGEMPAFHVADVVVGGGKFLGTGAANSS